MLINLGNSNQYLHRLTNLTSQWCETIMRMWYINSALCFRVEFGHPFLIPEETFFKNRLYIWLWKESLFLYFVFVAEWGAKNESVIWGAVRLGRIELICDLKLHNIFFEQVCKSARLWKNKIKCLFSNQSRYFWWQFPRTWEPQESCKASAEVPHNSLLVPS